jgi:3-methylcrotonyl-CoA carboxylase alpha subunit
VEHPVTEQVTGLDLVRAQLVVASGDALPWTQAEIAQRGHAIEARVYAEDPANAFLPQAGRLSVYRAPHLPGVRIDSGVAEGSEMSVYYDPMMAKVIATAESRPLAINRLAAALRELHIEGVRTNVPFLIRVLELPAFREGKIDTGFLDRERATLAEHLPAIELRATSIGQPATSNERRDTSYDPWNGQRASAGKPLADQTAGRGLAGQAARRPASRAVAGEAVTAPMPATVIKINVKPGDAVKKGDILILLEAMKMELPVRALDSGTVRAVRCREGELVDADAVLMEMQ